MSEVKVIYGSSTGNTAGVAARIAAAFGAEALNVAEAKVEDFQADLLILGSSTWGLGELQDDWAAKIDLLDQADLAGCKVALFGLGDQEGFSDSYCDAVGILADKVTARGAELIGFRPAEGYSYLSSKAERDGRLVGLLLDQADAPELSESRIAGWIETVKKARGEN